MKREQLQIRVSAAQKADLRRRARLAGMDVSSFVLSRVLPPERDRLAAILRGLRRARTRRFALAELNDLLEALPADGFAEALAAVDLDGVGAADRNRVAAMVEHAAARKGAAPPEWTRGVEPPDAPDFATDLPGLRAHLLRASPVAFRRRNLFVDSSIGDRA
ncbi:MAG TPA: hypothetical protein VFS92_02170 [Planctomycetota bacterium]|nr:hypothetical protein [Planctomycetota bacterium]